MTRRSSLQVAHATAFRKPARRDSLGQGPLAGPVQTRISPWALAFVAGFPGLIGVVALAVAAGRSIPDDGAVGMGVFCVTLAAILLVLGTRSVCEADRDRFTVRYFGVRQTTIRFDELADATFVMSFPSLSFAIVLRDRAGRTARFHANWWRREGPILEILLQALVDRDVALDRSTARIVSRVLGVKRPKARIIHRGLLRKDRTW